jgi:hypothetical protein
MRTQKEIEEYLDVHVTEIILQLKAKIVGVEPMLVSGYITGFFLATAIKIAQMEGVPRAIVEKTIMEVIRRQYAA